MATQLRPRTNGHVRDHIDTLRRTVRELLNEVEDGTRIARVNPEGIDFYEAVARFETDLIASALEAAGGRQNRAARLLKLRCSTLNAKMKALNLR